MTACHLKYLRLQRTALKRRAEAPMQNAAKIGSQYFTGMVFDTSFVVSGFLISKFNDFAHSFLHTSDL